MAWSKLTKNEKLLNGFQRKVLYEAGHYNFIFISRLHRLMQTLKELATQLGEDQEDTVIELQNIGYSCYLKVQAHAGYPELQFMYGEALYYGLYDLEENEVKICIIQLKLISTQCDSYFWENYLFALV
jgi:hypothetical protein